MPRTACFRFGKYASWLIMGTAIDILDNISKVIVGKRKEMTLIMSSMLAGGHVLLEDAPGTGKTILAKALAASFAVNFSRVQFTPDLLPSDLVGINFYNPKDGTFTFRKGAVFTNILLADEINRATPRTQSGLLESMEEKQITVDGITHLLDAPYFVIATQNPIETQGTFPLPEAQLDRFLIKLSLGYPETSESVSILKRFIQNNPLSDLKPVATREELLSMQAEVSKVHISDTVFSYIIDLTEETRRFSGVVLGVSTRGALALSRLSQAYAYINGKQFVTPDDIRILLPYVYAHRIIVRGTKPENVCSAIFENVKAPTENW